MAAPRPLDAAAASVIPHSVLQLGTVTLIAMVAYELRMVLWQHFVHFGAGDFPSKIPF